MMAPPEVVSPFFQILGLGVIWTFIHCSPMCGPIVAGLRLGEGRKSVSPFYGLLAYQSGRALIYAFVGGFAGLFGAQFFQNPRLSWILVFILAFLFLIQTFPKSFKMSGKTPEFLTRGVRWASEFHGITRAFFFGLLFAFLPCMLVFWALSVAASTKSFFRGALVMVLLVVLTTLPLLTVSYGSHRLLKGHQKSVTSAILFISFLWTLLVSLAANDLISHLHWQFILFGRDYTMMFW